VGTDSRTNLPQPDANTIVIGQVDRFHSNINYPNSDATKPSDQGLFQPIGIVVDANGNIYVADSGNSRIVRFPAPFAGGAQTPPHANLVLGQISLTASKITDASSANMSAPWGLALFLRRQSGCLRRAA